MAAVDESALPVPNLQKAFTCSSGAGGADSSATLTFVSQDEETELSENRRSAEFKNKTAEKHAPTAAAIFLSIPVGYRSRRALARFDIDHIVLNCDIRNMPC